MTIAGPSGTWTVPVRKKFFTVRVVRHWKGLPREVVDVSSLEVFKDRLSEAFRNLVFWNVLCLWQPGWKWMTLKVPSKPNHFIIL